MHHLFSDASYRFRLHRNDQVKVNNSTFPNGRLPIIPVRLHGNDKFKVNNSTFPTDHSPRTTPHHSGPVAWE